MNIDGDIVTKSYEVGDFDDLVSDLISELEIRNYKVTRINHIDNILDQRERGLSGQMTFQHFKIVEFCNLNSCAQMLSSNALAGVFMPVRFVIHQGAHDSKAHVAYLRPTKFAALFDSTGVRNVAIQLEKDMADVLEEIAY